MFPVIMEKHSSKKEDGFTKCNASEA
uniref:Uncharacterized protein n=1 Tax=Rhizophora mucronata TaxID=61149 RepID=A0A2P2P8F4_RHIMU